MKRRYYVLVALLLAVLVWLLWQRSRGPVPEPGAGIAPKPEAPLAAAPKEVAAPEVAAPPAAPAAAVPRSAHRPPRVAVAPPAPAAPPAAVPPAPAPIEVGPPPGGPGSVVGRVVRTDGTPVTRFALNGTAISSPDGAFRLEAPRSGTVKMVVRSEGNATALARATGVVGEVAVPDIVVDPGVAVSGEVLDADTRMPVAEAHAALADRVDVEATLASGEELTQLVEPATTGSGGMFFLERAPRGRLVLLVSHPRYRMELLEVDTNDRRADLTLKRGGSVSGRVLSAAGQPLAGTRVVALSRSAMDAREGKTDSNGHFQLGPLHPGRYMVLARPADAAQVLGSQVVEVTEDKVASAEFRARADGTTVRVRIVDERGAPVAGEALLAHGDVPLPGSFAALAESAPLLPAARHGNAQVIAHVPPGAYTLFVLRDGQPEPAFVREALDVKPGAEMSVEVKVPDRAAMSGSGLPGSALATLR
jgi:hypothetical protein